MTGSALVVGAGPAGLMAAEVLAEAGIDVTVADRMPSFGRKFLMAGKSGLNLTKVEPQAAFLGQFCPDMRPFVERFDAQAVMDWAAGLGQHTFVGSTGRVFPTAMKASPLLRAWLERLRQAGVVFQMRWQWTGFDGGTAAFDTPGGLHRHPADVVVLALGGASWKRLGSDGNWISALGVPTAPFAPANCGFMVPWSSHMTAHLGHPVKATALTAGALSSRGEWVLTREGVEGGGIYEVSAAVRDGHPLDVDLCPDLALDQVAARIAGRNRKRSLSAFLRSRLGLSAVKLALFNELKPEGSSPADLAATLKSLRLPVASALPLDRAISTAGGVRFDAVTMDLMLKAHPGVFIAGEMLDWEAITGGYLLTGCLATGRAAGQGAVSFLGE